MSYNNKLHCYTIVDFPSENQTYGKFKAFKPKIAANRAFSSLIKFVDIEDKSNDDSFLGKFLVFVIKDLNTNQEYKYIGNRIKLKNPVKVIKNGRDIEYKYKNVIGKYNNELDKI
jgi:ribosomal protein L35AE/L33A